MKTLIDDETGCVFNFWLNKDSEINHVEIIQYDMAAYVFCSGKVLDRYIELLTGKSMAKAKSISYTPALESKAAYTTLSY